MSDHYLEFEVPIAQMQIELDKIIIANQKNPNVGYEKKIQNLKKKIINLTENIFSNLTPWQTVQVARHIKRPHSIDYINNMIDDFQELHGDRICNDDRAVICGIGELDKNPVMVIAQEKGRTIEEKVKCNFGMLHPWGFRKVSRLLKLAEKFRLPVICFIDTPGAYPGIEAEDFGQSEAIASNLKLMTHLKVPIIGIILGEGCSGGALGIGVTDRLLILEHAYFATISPEGCASILFKTTAKAEHAAEIMKITAPDLLAQNIVDEIIKEPIGGAHSNPKEQFQLVRTHLVNNLATLKSQSIESIIKARFEKFMSYGHV